MDTAITFGIITDGQNPERLAECVDSVQRQAEITDDIIVVGGRATPQSSLFAGLFHTWIPFDETIKDKWITKKKNLIAQLARSEVLCLMHDYVALQPGWRDGLSRFNWNWHRFPTCTNKILNADGKRFRDWCVIYNDAWMNPPIDDEKPPENIDGHLLQYDNTSMGRWQYLSGAYYLCSRYIMQHHPLNEERVWGQGEDVEWCRRVYSTYREYAFCFNPYSTVKFLKQKEHAPWEAFSPL